MITVKVSGPNAAEFENDIHDALTDSLNALASKFDLPPILITTENGDSIRMGWV